MPSLMDVIRTEEIVLLDSGVLEGIGYSGFCDEIYEARDFSHISARAVFEKLN